MKNFETIIENKNSAEKEKDKNLVRHVTEEVTWKH